MRKATPMNAKSRALIGLWRFVDTCMHGNFTREIREVPVNSPTRSCARAGWRRT